MNTFVIKSSSSSATLTFSHLTVSGFHVSYFSNDLSAKTTVYEDSGMGQQLVDFFIAIWEKADPWKELLSWSSLEGELEIQATTDKLGHVEFKLIFNKYTTKEPWTAETILTAELGQLEKISKGIQSFFSI